MNYEEYNKAMWLVYMGRFRNTETKHDITNYLIKKRLNNLEKENPNNGNSNTRVPR